MVAVLDDAAFLYGDYPVAMAHGGEPVRDDEYGAALNDMLHILLDDTLALIIERARGLVENKDARVHDQRPSNGDALALAAGEAAAALTYIGVITLR